jgi:hypothetical protein
VFGIPSLANLDDVYFGFFDDDEELIILVFWYIHAMTCILVYLRTYNTVI